MNFRHVSLTLLSAAAVGALVPSDLTAQTRKVNRRPEVNEKYGYAINLPEDWMASLISPDEKRLVGKFAPDATEIERRGDFRAQYTQLEVVRFPLAAGSTGDAAKEKKEKEEKEEKLRRILNRTKSPGDADNLTEYMVLRFDAEDRYRPKKFSAGRGSAKLTGTLAEFTSGAFFYTIAQFQGEGFEWALIFRCREDVVNDWKKCYQQSMRTFRVFEGEVTAGEAYAESEKKISEMSRDEQIEAIEKSIEGQRGWWSYTTDNYVFLSNSSNKGLIKTLAKDVETIRERVYEELFPPSKEITAIGTVRVFSDAAQYYAYGGSRGSAGYWNSRREELVLFDGFEDVSAARSVEYTKSVMYHEAFHQYIHYAVGDLAPHSWFNEGHGDYFAGHLIRGRRIKAEPFDWRIESLRRRLTLDMSLIPLQSLVRLPQSEYYTNAGLKYAQGWALIYFLREVTRNPRWRQIPDIYFEYLRDNLAAFRRAKDDSVDGEEGGESVPGIPGVILRSFEDEEKVQKILDGAVDEAFKGVDFAELDAAYLEWIKSIT